MKNDQRKSIKTWSVENLILKNNTGVFRPFLRANIQATTFGGGYWLTFLW